MADDTDALVAALCAAQCAGNPVPGGDPQRWQRIIRVARRRWNSFTRRHPAPASDTLAARAEDLARALLNRFGSDPDTGKPIDLTDCRDVARRLAGILGVETRRPWVLR